MLFLDLLFYIFLPLYPDEDPLQQDTITQSTTSQSQLSPYNTLALEYMAPKMALFVMLFGVGLSAIVEEYLGSMHVLAVGLFLVVRLPGGLRFRNFMFTGI